MKDGVKKNRNTIIQMYPREKDLNGLPSNLLDIDALLPHVDKIPIEKLNEFIIKAIEFANDKSKRTIISDNPTTEHIGDIYEKEGRKLFKYFKKSFTNPASSAYQIHNNHYKEIAEIQFHNRSLQMERMNAGWFYQYLAYLCASCSNRFKNVSQLGLEEADFNVVIEFIDQNLNPKPLNLYVSIKNRANTMGGQDWPKAIRALEEVAKNDKNRIGDYCCVFGLVMDNTGKRNVKARNKTKDAYSNNTEIWPSNFFWPFFSNFTYPEIIKCVLDVLKSEKETFFLEVPKQLIEAFGESCRTAGLIDADGKFNDPYKLVDFFCNK
jgi:hypothetical protein